MHFDDWQCEPHKSTQIVEQNELVEIDGYLAEQFGYSGRLRDLIRRCIVETRKQLLHLCLRVDADAAVRGSVTTVRSHEVA
jgi:hypothetical protein